MEGRPPCRPQGVCKSLPSPGPIALPSSLHLWRYYGFRSQAWLYRLLCGLTRYHPALLMRGEWIANHDLSEFPWPKGRTFYFPERPAITRAMAKIGPWLRSGNRHALGEPDVQFIRTLAAQQNVRILHIHFGWFACSLLADNPDFGIPAFVSFYGADVFTLAGREPYVRELRKFLAKGYPLLAISQHLRQGLIALGAKPDQVRVIPVGIDLNDMPGEDRVRERCSQRLSAKPIRLITIGRLVDYKAPQKLPAVAKRLKERGLDFQWNLVGEGPLLEQIRSNSEALSVTDCFHICGGIPFAELKDLLWSSDIMVHNAIVAPDGGRECLGVSLIEAQAIGIPVVSCKVGGIPEAVADGQTGLLVEEGDVEALADAVMRLATDPALRHEMALAGMRRARDHFDSAKLAMQLEGIYDSIIEFPASPWILPLPGILPGL